MMHAEFNLVLKYSEALDEFIKIRVFSEEDAREVIKKATGGDKSRYHQEIIRACISDYNENILPRMHEMREASSSIDIEEMLYLLCVDVNPTLDIHQVSVQVTSAQVENGTDTALAANVRKKNKKNLRRIQNIDKELKRRVIGQDKAIETISKAIKKAAVGLRDPKRPIGAFLFVGQVGVGKTELAKALVEYLYESQSRLIRVDCSEYALPHEYAKLIGSPPGYIGHNEGGYLTEAAKELDEFVLLFDEIEKAHSKMHNILLQLLDEGMITDSKGFKVSFRNALVLMTSNLGVREVEGLRSGIGFDLAKRQEISYTEMTTEINGALKKAFRPEFLNRLDDVIVFNTLTLKDSIRIVEKMLRELGEIAQRAGFEMTTTPELRHHIAEQGFKQEWGGRELRRTIKRLVEDPLTDMLLRDEIGDGSEVEVDVRADRTIRFDVKAGARQSALTEPVA
jgi:ATP-dependent Clp protease ATP-binding subunit ClpA